MRALLVINQVLLIAVTFFSLYFAPSRTSSTEDGATTSTDATTSDKGEHG